MSDEEDENGRKVPASQSSALPLCHAVSDSGRAASNSRGADSSFGTNPESVPPGENEEQDLVGTSDTRGDERTTVCGPVLDSLLASLGAALHKTRTVEGRESVSRIPMSNMSQPPTHGVTPCVGGRGMLRTSHASNRSGQIRDMPRTNNASSDRQSDSSSEWSRMNNASSTGDDDASHTHNAESSEAQNVDSPDATPTNDASFDAQSTDSRNANSTSSSSSDAPDGRSREASPTHGHGSASSRNVTSTDMSADPPRPCQCTETCLHDPQCSEYSNADSPVFQSEAGSPASFWPSAGDGASESGIQGLSEGASKLGTHGLTGGASTQGLTVGVSKSGTQGLTEGSQPTQQHEPGSQKVSTIAKKTKSMETKGHVKRDHSGKSRWSLENHTCLIDGRGKPKIPVCECPACHIINGVPSIRKTVRKQEIQDANKHEIPPERQTFEEREKRRRRQQLLEAARDMANLSSKRKVQSICKSGKALHPSRATILDRGRNGLVVFNTTRPWERLQIRKGDCINRHPVARRIDETSLPEHANTIYRDRMFVPGKIIQTPPTHLLGKRTVLVQCDVEDSEYRPRFYALMAEKNDEATIKTDFRVPKKSTSGI